MQSDHVLRGEAERYTVEPAVPGGLWISPSKNPPERRDSTMGNRMDPAYVIMQNGRDLPRKPIDFSVSDVGACLQAILTSESRASSLPTIRIDTA
jgi:hypothetical protein